MINPYEPTELKGQSRERTDDTRLYRIAGLWLLVAGLLHLAAANALVGVTDFASVDWSPVTLVGLGVLVVFRFKIAIVLARLMGSITIVGFFLVGALLLAGYGPGSGLTYGQLSIEDPHWWQVAVMVCGTILTIMPPWYMLQRAYLLEAKLHQSGEARGVVRDE